MILDALWLFSGASGGVGNNDGKTDSPTTGSQVSSNIVDLAIGTAANPALPPSVTTYGGQPGRDLGIGDDPAMKLMVIVTTAFSGGTSLQINIQGAPDNGSSLPGSYTVFATGPAIIEANLIAGCRLFDVDMPRPPMNSPFGPPRFIQLGYVTVGTHTLGKLEGLFVLDRNDQPMSAAATTSAYPPGIAIAN